MSTNGRPTDYKPEYRELGRKYCLLGATNDQLADFLGVTRRTISNWVERHPDFAAALRAGRDVADAEIAQSLFARGKGFSQEVTRSVLYQGEVKTVTNTVQYPPDTQACIFWLRNRRRQTWRGDRSEEATDRVADEIALLDAATGGVRDDDGD